MKNKPYIDAITCVGCSLCIENCLMNCLELSKPNYRGDINTYAYLSNPDKCMGCGICAKSCPTKVITMVNGNIIPEHLTKGETKTMWKVYCRVFQAVMKIGNYFMGYRTPETLEGPGSVKQLPEVIEAQGVDKVLIVIGPNIYKRGLADSMIQGLEEQGIEYAVFSDLQANPTDENVEAGLAAYRQNNCKGIIAFGGGSPIDCAKAIAARDANPHKTVAQMQGLLKAHRRICPFWAVPTTSGTGTETTVAAVITEAATHHKASINDTAILPKQAVLDPELTVGLSPFTTATTGMDALCHAVECYTNYTYCTPLEKEYARKAVRLIYDNLYTAYIDGSNLTARQNMQLAAFYAGRAFTRGCVGYVHACGHPLSALYDLPHGLVMGVLLPHVMRQFGRSAQLRLAELADVCELGGKTTAEKAERFIAWIEKINEKMGLPKGFDVIDPKDVPQMCAWADAEANPLYPTPAIWGEVDFCKLYGTLRRAGIAEKAAQA